MEKEEETECSEGTEGEKCYVHATAKKQQGSQNLCANCSATWLGHMEIEHDIYHNLIEFNFERKLPVWSYIRPESFIILYAEKE